MSGVEILGIVASASQFLDIGARLALSLARLKDVPRSVERAANELSLLVNIVGTIKTNLEGPGESVSVKNVDIGLELLQKCKERAHELNHVLDGVTLQTTDGVVKKSWKAVISLKRDSKVSEMLSGLEKLKSSLEIWISHETWVVSSAQR
jgi:N-terminal domain on NACHT_NTPase and P-loop NTPases